MMRFRIRYALVATFMTGIAIVFHCIAEINSEGDFFAPNMTLVFNLLSIGVGIAAFFIILFFIKSIKVATVIIVGGFLLFFVSSKLDPVYIAFLIMKNDYVEKIRSLNSSEPKFVVLREKESLEFPSGAAWDYVIFDSSDELNLPSERRTPEWLRLHRAYVTPPTPDCSIETKHLEGHFFFLTKRC